MTTEKPATRLERCRKRGGAVTPTPPPAHFNLGLAYTQQGQVRHAPRTAYRKALELDPDLVEAWVNLGGVLLLKWDFQGCAGGQPGGAEAAGRPAAGALQHGPGAPLPRRRGRTGRVHAAACSSSTRTTPRATTTWPSGCWPLDRVDEARARLWPRDGAGPPARRPEFLRALERGEQHED